MTDVDDRGAAGGDSLDNAAQLFDAGKVERRRRLVEQKNRRIGRQRLDDLEELPLGRVELPRP